VEADALVGDPADVVVDLSRSLALLVLGSRGYGPLRAVLLGSVSQRLAQLLGRLCDRAGNNRAVTSAR
jgi:nucleotide-binding universal stress UspA family protein